MDSTASLKNVAVPATSRRVHVNEIIPFLYVITRPKNLEHVTLNNVNKLRQKGSRSYHYSAVTWSRLTDRNFLLTGRFTTNERVLTTRVEKLAKTSTASMMFSTTWNRLLIGIRYTLTFNYPNALQISRKRSAVAKWEVRTNGGNYLENPMACSSEVWLLCVMTAH